MSAEHTLKAPLTLTKEGAASVIRQQDGLAAAIFTGHFQGDHQILANLVHAANNHGKLVEMLAKLIPYAESAAQYAVFSSQIGEIKSDIDAAKSLIQTIESSHP